MIEQEFGDHHRSPNPHPRTDAFDMNRSEPTSAVSTDFACAVLGFELA
jgi:hypothetical protein